MTRITLSTLTLIGMIGATNAHAKLIGASLTLPDESSVSALHRPTGCVAQVIFSYDAFVKAQITDPTCLPRGIDARDIPSKLDDFVLSPTN